IAWGCPMGYTSRRSRDVTGCVAEVPYPASDFCAGCQALLTAQTPGRRFPLIDSSSRNLYLDWPFLRESHLLNKALVSLFPHRHPWETAVPGVTPGGVGGMIPPVGIRQPIRAPRPAWKTARSGSARVLPPSHESWSEASGRPSPQQTPLPSPPAVAEKRP